MVAFKALLGEWLAALGRWRLLAALATAVALAWLGPQLASTRKPAFDMAVLDAVHSAIPDALGPVLISVYQLSGKHVGAVLVLAVVIFLALRRFWADLVCLAIGTGGILLIVDRGLKPSPAAASPAATRPGRWCSISSPAACCRPITHGCGGRCF
jgi:undecaprenyl-diphosphatase